MVPRRLYLTSRGEVTDPDTVQLNPGLEDMSLEEEAVFILFKKKIFISIFIFGYAGFSLL